MSGESIAPIAVALDAPDHRVFRSWARAVAPSVRCLKVGLEVFARQGPQSVRDAREAASEAGRPDIEVFIDLKLHDIPATVGKAAGSLADLQPSYVTVHAAGGPEMVQAAARALPQTKITAVTVLTSLDAQQLAQLGITGTPVDIVSRWAKTSVDAGARAVVCSAQEVAVLRSVLPADITLITPGVRPAGSIADDQRRTATPQEALAAGADLLVVGRPITQTPDPAAAAAELARTLRPVS